MTPCQKETKGWKWLKLSSVNNSFDVLVLQGRAVAGLYINKRLFAAHHFIGQ